MYLFVLQNVYKYVDKGFVSESAQICNYRKHG